MTRTSRSKTVVFTYPQAVHNRRYRKVQNYYVNSGPDRLTPSPYSMSLDLIESTNVPNGADAPNEFAGFIADGGTTEGINSSAVIAMTYSRAYASWWNKARDQASLGATFAEGGQSLSMIANRSIQLRNAFTHLRRGRFGDFLDTLGVSRRGRKIPPRSRQVSEVALEYSFGWAPLLSDIYTACQVLSSAPKNRVIRSGSKSEMTARASYGAANFFNVTLESRLLMQAEYRITSPNLDLANRLGLINPVSVLWEVVPFSFLLDYILPVGQFLNNLSNLAGVELVNAFQTRTTVSTSTKVQQYPDAPFGKVYTTVAKSVRLNRSLGNFSPPPLQFVPLRISPRRAVTSVALLLTTLNSDFSRPFRPR